MSEHHIWTRHMREAAANAVMDAPNGSVVTISPPPTTWDQTKKMWAMLGEIAEAKPLGRDAKPDTWKLILMRAMGHETQFELDLKGRPFPTGFSSKKMGKKAMSEFIEFLYAFGAEHGVKFKEGND
jgi:hypothetical protein